MPITFIPFDGWSPSGSYFGEGWNTAQNLYPAYNNFRPWRVFAPTGGTIGIVTGAHCHTWTSGLGGASYIPDAQTVFCGTGSSALALPERLYTVDSAGTFTDISRGALYSAFTAGWRFQSVGNDIWAANGVDPIQRRTNNAASFADGAVSTFSPKARFLAACREHLVAAGLSNAGRFQDELAFSDADDATNWDPAAAGSTSTSIAGAKRLVSIPGQLTGLLGGQYLLAFKRKGIFYGEYSGPPQVFNFDVLSPNIGTPWPSSIINSRFGVFFAGVDGLYRIEGLQSPTPLSPPGVSFGLMPLLAAYPSSSYAWHEDIAVIGFQMYHLPLVGWLIGKPFSDVGAYFGIVYTPLTNAWGRVTVLNGSAKPTAVVSLSGANDIYSGLIAFTYDGTAGRFAPLSSDASLSVYAPSLQLNFRPINADSQSRQKRGNEMGQSMLHGVLPIFSKTATGGAPLTESVSVEAFLDPHGSVTSTETRTYSERNVISGYYPFATAGRFFRITINCGAEDFASFEGLYVNFEELAG